MERKKIFARERFVMRSWNKARRKNKKTTTRYGGSTVIVRNEHGPPCPRCHQITEVREHQGLTEKQQRQPFYYARWYRCTNSQCRTTLIMPEEFKVWRGTGDIALDVLNDESHGTTVEEQQTDRPPWE
jgi:hypothetical protein